MIMSEAAIAANLRVFSDGILIGIDTPWLI